MGPTPRSQRRLFKSKLGMIDQASERLHPRGERGQTFVQFGQRHATANMNTRHTYKCTSRTILSQLNHLDHLGSQETTK